MVIERAVFKVERDVVSAIAQIDRAVEQALTQLAPLQRALLHIDVDLIKVNNRGERLALIGRDQGTARNLRGADDARDRGAHRGVIKGNLGAGELSLVELFVGLR